MWQYFKRSWWVYLTHLLAWALLHFLTITLVCLNTVFYATLPVGSQLQNIIAHLNCFEISHMLIFIYVLIYTCDQYALWHVKRKCVFVISATDMQDKMCNKRNDFNLRSMKCCIKPKFVGKQMFHIFCNTP